MKIKIIKISIKVVLSLICLFIAFLYFYYRKNDLELTTILGFSLYTILAFVIWVKEFLKFWKWLNNY